MKAKNTVTLIPSSSSLLMIRDIHSEPNHIFLTTPIYPVRSFFFKDGPAFYLFIYLAALCGLWDLSSLTRD